jgi:hypothetical protein
MLGEESHEMPRGRGPIRGLRGVENRLRKRERGREAQGLGRGNRSARAREQESALEVKRVAEHRGVLAAGCRVGAELDRGGRTWRLGPRRTPQTDDDRCDPLGA